MQCVLNVLPAYNVPLIAMSTALLNVLPEEHRVRCFPNAFLYALLNALSAEHSVLCVLKVLSYTLLNDASTEHTTVCDASARLQYT